MADSLKADTEPNQTLESSERMPESPRDPMVIATEAGGEMSSSADHSSGCTEMALDGGIVGDARPLPPPRDRGAPASGLPERWRTDSCFVGRRVRRLRLEKQGQLSRGRYLEGNVVGWLSAQEAGAIDSAGEVCAVWHVIYDKVGAALPPRGNRDAASAKYAVSRALPSPEKAHTLFAACGIRKRFLVSLQAR